MHRRTIHSFPTRRSSDLADDQGHGVATKTKDAAGKDTLSVDFPDEDIRNILRNVADLFELNLLMPESLTGKTTIKLRDVRSEEHTSELQSRSDIVCRLLL